MVTMPPVLDFPRHLETEGLSPAQALALAAAGGFGVQQFKPQELPVPTHVRDTVSPYDAPAFANHNSAVSATAPPSTWWDYAPSFTTQPRNLIVKPGIFAERVATNPWPDIKGKYNKKHGRSRFSDPALHHLQFDWFFNQQETLDWLKQTGFADIFPPDVVSKATLRYVGQVRKGREDKIQRGVAARNDVLQYPGYHRDGFRGFVENEKEDEKIIGQLIVAVPWERTEASTIVSTDRMRVLPTTWMVDDVPGAGRGLYHSEPHFGKKGDFSSERVQFARFFLYADTNDVDQLDSERFAGSTGGKVIYPDYDGNEVYVGGGVPRNFAPNEIVMQAANLNPDLKLV
jgi:hypothetical protein